MPVVCESGYYQEAAGSTTCDVCPVGHACLNGESAAPCSNGTASVEGQANCTACEGGYYANRTMMERCSLCPAGHQCGDTSLSPVLCLRGEYSREGVVVCSPCEAGSYCPTLGTVEPQNCSLGEYSQAGAAECTVCPVGHRCAQPFEGMSQVVPYEFEEG